MEHDSNADKITAQFLSAGLRAASLDPTGQGVFLDFAAYLEPGATMRVALHVSDAQRIPAALRQLADMLEAQLPPPAGTPLN